LLFLVPFLLFYFLTYFILLYILDSPIYRLLWSVFYQLSSHRDDNDDNNRLLLLGQCCIFWCGCSHGLSCYSATNLQRNSMLLAQQLELVSPQVRTLYYHMSVASMDQRFQLVKQSWIECDAMGTNCFTTTFARKIYKSNGHNTHEVRYNPKKKLLSPRGE
jgi:hypothetical protein